MCLGPGRDSGSKKIYRHPLDFSFFFFFIVRPKTGGRMNFVMDATSSSTTWKVTPFYIFPKSSATCNGR